MALKPIVYVLWKDAWGTTDYVTKEEALAHGPCMMETVGFIIADTAEGITLAAGCYLDQNEGGYQGPGFIPRGMIAEVVELHAKRKTRTKKKYPLETSTTES